MLTVNLEKSLIKAKQKTIKKINSEIDKGNNILKIANDILAKDNENDLQLLRECGLDSALNELEMVNLETQKKKTNIKNIDNERIFTEEEIKDIAIKYGLRFLSSKKYQGNLPNDLAQKIKEFKELGLKQARDYDYWTCIKHEYYILAPAKSFNLQEKPKDPLFFTKLEDGNYYLIHKWGNDLSIFRYLKNLPIRNRKCLSISLFSLFISLCYLVFFCFSSNRVEFGLIAIIITVPAFILFISSRSMSEKDNDVLNINKWNSYYF